MTTGSTENELPIPPRLTADSEQYAFFFDVDGTLAEICPEPDSVTIPAPVLANLQALSSVCRGAVALVSGRPIEQLDRLTAPLRLPLAGIHGAELRDGADNIHRATLAPEIAVPLQQMLEQGMATMPGTLLEAKGLAFALHYRQAMFYEPQVLALAQAAVEEFPQLALQPGKCVVEIKPQGTDKGAAIATFMRHAPFAGRIPVFVGDDLTDEQGFLAVNALHGISVKVGDGTGHACYRLKQVAEVYDWLAQLVLQFKQDHIGKGSRL